MSKKRSKANLGSAGTQKWEQALMTTSFCEEDQWTATIAFVNGNRLDDYQHIEALNSVVSSGIRRLFSIITKEELYAQVNDLGNPRSKKSKEIPLHSEVCEPCKMHLDTGDDIPAPLLAKLIKWKLLDLKQKDLKRRENEKKAGSEKGKSKKGDKKDRARSPGKGKGGGKKTPEPPSPKTESKLRKRGEEATDNKYIDDEPDDGPQHYVLISGFHEPHLVTFLSDLGIHVDCIVRVVSEEYAPADLSGRSADDLDEPKDSKQLLAEEESQQQKERATRQLKVFWKDILPLMQKAVPGSKVHDVARLEYIVKGCIVPEDKEDASNKTEFGMVLFEDIACMIYDLLDNKRLWKTYLENLQLVHVPESSDGQGMQSAVQEIAQPQPSPVTSRPGESVNQADAKADALPDTMDMRYYNELLNSVPQESISIPLIMHCMLEQVSATEEDKPPPSETPRPQRCDGLESEVASHISQMAFKLALTEPEVQALLASDFEPPKAKDAPCKQPLLINYQDEITKRLNHLAPVPDFDARSAELELMGYLPMSRLSQLRKPSEKVAQERAARLQELLYFCTTGNLSPAEIDRAFKQFVFECMDLKTAAQDGTVTADGLAQQKPTQKDIMWDDPYPFYKGMIPQMDDDMEEEVMMEGAPEDQIVVTALSTEFQADELRSASEMYMGPTVPSSESHPPSGGETGQPSSRSGSRRSRKKKKGSKSPIPAPPASATPEPVPAEQQQDEEGSRPSSGILKQRSTSAVSASKKSMTALSVHFEKSQDGLLLLQPGDDHVDIDEEILELLEAPAQLDIAAMYQVNDTQKRNLDRWCFAEHLEPHVLLQVLRSALYTHPFVDTYYHKRDHSMLVVLHNPCGEQLQSKVNWQAKLHSDVSFRNYLEHVADSISDWTREQDAKYQASLLAQEVEKLHKEADDEASQASSSKGKGKKDRSKSPKKSPTRGGRSPSRSSSADLSSSSNPLVRPGSLKAWKEEQDRIEREEEEKERQKAEKRARSAQKKADKEALEKEEKEKKRPGSRSSAKSKVSKEEAPATTDANTTEGTEHSPKYWPFTGYDMGNNLAHASGVIATMFPADGGQIRTEKISLTQGSTTVRTTVLKDGHLLSIHILDPKVKGEDEAEDQVLENNQAKTDADKSEKELPAEYAGKGLEEEEELETKLDAVDILAAETKKPCVGRFGSFTAQLADGMTLSLSTYGPSGEPEDGTPYEPATFNVHLPRTPSPSVKDSVKKGAKGSTVATKEKQSTPEPTEISGESKEEEVSEPAGSGQPFQQLNIACPDGLCLNYQLESALGIVGETSEERRLLVRQSYPFKTHGVQACEAARKRAMEEVSRVINSDGTVVKTMQDGTTEVLFASGTVSQLVQSSPLIPEARTVLQSQRAESAKSDKESPKKGRSSRKNSRKEISQDVLGVEEVLERGYWITTLPSGERLVTRVDGSPVVVKEALISVASDPMSQQSMHTREDHVVMVHHPDGSTVVEHADGTRITSLSKQVEVTVTAGDAEETGEAPVKETTEVMLVQVECPGFATLRFHGGTGECSSEFATGTIVHTYVDGSYDIFHTEGGYLRVDSDACARYYPKHDSNLEMLDPNQQLQYVLRHFADVICESVDNDGNVFNVKNDGESIVMPAAGQDVVEELASPSGEPAQHQAAAEETAESIEREEAVANHPEPNEDVISAEEPTSGMPPLDHPEPAATSPPPEAHGGDTQSEPKWREEEVAERAGKETIITREVAYYKQHAPRLFVLHSDGSGTELLRYQDVADYIARAEDDPATAILVDPLADYPGVLGITILKPYIKNISEQWFQTYAAQSIVPPGLRSRDLQNLPYHETRTNGPKFGAQAGQGLAIGSLMKPVPAPPMLKCPTTLEVRQILQYKPITEELRSSLSNSLREYAENAKQKLVEAKALSVEDPRTEEERIHAADLQQLAEQEAEKSEMQTPRPWQGSQDMEMPCQGRSSGLEDVKALYEKVTAPGMPSPPPTPQCKRTEADWERDRRELAEESDCRRALRQRDIPPYFESEFGKSFLLSQLMRIYGHEAPDMDTLARQLAREPPCRENQVMQRQHSGSPPQSGSAPGKVSPPASESSGDTGAQRQQSAPGHGPTPAFRLCYQISSPEMTLASSEEAGNTLSALRPGNPTPVHATGEGSPAPVRPHGPTPSHGHKSVQDRPGAPTPKAAATAETSPSAGDSDNSQQENTDNGVMLTRLSTESTQVNVIGKPRSQPVRAPAYMRSGRPGAQPNKRFEQIEDSVRRKVYTTSTAGATEEGSTILTGMRGFELLPGRVDFGTLKEGNTYSFTVHMKNTGVDSCRFKLKQPPPSTGLKIIYRPGPVAAGMKVELQVEIYAIAVGVEGERGVGSVAHQLEITTETHHMLLPITATVLTTDEFENRSPDSPRGGMATGVRLISSKPPSGQGIIRPRDEMPVGAKA